MASPSASKDASPDRLGRPAREASDHLFGTNVVSLRGGPATRTSTAASDTSVPGFPCLWISSWLLVSILVGVAILVALGVTERGVPRGFEAEAVFNMLLGVAFTYGCVRILFRGASGRLPGTGESRSGMPESGGDGQLSGDAGAG